MYMTTFMQISNNEIFDSAYYRKDILDIRKSIYIVFDPDKNKFGIVNAEASVTSLNKNKHNVPVIAILPQYTRKDWAIHPLLIHISSGFLMLVVLWREE